MYPAIVELQQRLDATFHLDRDAVADDNKTQERGFTPHLSVGQYKPNEVANFATNFRATWSAIEFEVSEIAIISRTGFEDPFTIKKRIKLGGTPKIGNDVVGMPANIPQETVGVSKGSNGEVRAKLPGQSAGIKAESLSKPGKAKPEETSTVPAGCGYA